MKNILTSVSIPTETSATEAAFNKYITQQIVLNTKRRTSDREYYGI
jgi:Na+-transporting NADH:ubiquinone oxidoreductase subunit C